MSQKLNTEALVQVLTEKLRGVHITYTPATKRVAAQRYDVATDKFHVRQVQINDDFTGASSIAGEDNGALVSAVRDALHLKVVWE